MIDERGLNVEKVQRALSLEMLVNDSNFQNVFMDYFLKTSLNEMIYREGPSEGVVRAIHARKTFNDFIYDIMDEGKQAEIVLKG